MNENSRIMNRIRKYFALLFLFQLFFTWELVAQEKQSIRIDLSYHQLNNNLPSLNALVRTRIDRRYQPVEKVHVKFYHTEMDETNLLGTATSDVDGKAILQLGTGFKSFWDSTSIFRFIASVSDDPNYEDNESDREITKAEMSIELIEGEERQVKVQIQKYLEDGSVEPASEIYVKLQVKRLFSSLPIGDDNYETDDEGVFTTSFPEDIPGGRDGTLTIVAFVEDDDDLGYLIVEKEASWGTIVAEDVESFSGRSLWAARDKAPIWLLVFPNLIIISIWGTIIYLIILIFKIRKMGKST